MKWKLGLVTGFALALGLAAALDRRTEASIVPQEAPKAAPATLKPATRADAAPASIPAAPAGVRSATAAGRADLPGAEGAVARQDGRARIAVVHLNECFDEKKYDKIKAIRAEFEGMIKTLDEEAKNFEADVKAKADQIKLFPAGSKGRQDAVKKYELARAQLQIHKAAAKEIALNGYAKFQAEAYQEILRVIGLVGAEGGYDLVLKLDDVKFEDDNQPVDVSQQIAIKGVLFAAPTMDITDRVIQRLNQEYKKP